MCCLFGLMDCAGRLSVRQKEELVNALAGASEARGTDAAGIAYNSGGRLRIYKRPGPAHRLRFRVPEDARVVMGHTRMTTQGSARRNRNNHPFAGRTADSRFALAHNGVLCNDRALRREKKLPGTSIETDSYVAVQLLERQGALTPDSLREMAETVEGSFVFTVLDECDGLFFVKGDNPLCLMHLPEQELYVYASTREVLNRGLEQSWLRGIPLTEIPVESGEILCISPDGTRRWDRFRWTPRHFAGWSMDWLDWPGRGYAFHGPEPQYLRQLKGVTAFFGYSGEEIDDLLAEGWTTDEIEELMYCG